MTRFLRAAALAVLVCAAGQAISAPRTSSRPPAPAPSAPPAAGGPVVYWISAGTDSGMGGMGGMGAGGHRPSTAEMMQMQNRGPNAYSHSLMLQLGSPRRPTGDPQAEHDPPPGLGVGAALPLVTPVQTPRGETPPDYHPQGRMLIFWGCGEHVGPNQPLVIDLSSPDHGAAQFAAMGRTIGTGAGAGPSAARNATYGEWPNPQNGRAVPQDGSLQGAHTIRGNYTPQIDFSLTANQDFLPPFRITSNAKAPSGAVALGWRPVDGAQAYLATVVGAQGQNQVVMWSSSSVQAMAGSVGEYLADAEIARLVAAHVLLPASQTSCTVPQEVVQAVGTGVFRLIGFGGEANLAYPPRPPEPQPWRPVWTVKVRYRSAASGLLGMDMERMMSGHDDDDGDPQPQQPPPRRSNPFNPFGGMVP